MERENKPEISEDREARTVTLNIVGTFDYRDGLEISMLLNRALRRILNKGCDEQQTD